MSTHRPRLSTDRTRTVCLSERDMSRLRTGLRHSLAFVDAELYAALLTTHQQATSLVVFYRNAQAELLDLLALLDPTVPALACINCDDDREPPCPGCKACGACCTCPPPPPALTLAQLHTWLVQQQFLEQDSPAGGRTEAAARQVRLATLDQLTTICATGRLPVAPAQGHDHDA